MPKIKPGRKKIGERCSVVLPEADIAYIKATRDGRDFSARVRDLVRRSIQAELAEQSVPR